MSERGRKEKDKERGGGRLEEKLKFSVRRPVCVPLDGLKIHQYWVALRTSVSLNQTLIERRKEGRWGRGKGKNDKNNIIETA